MAVSQQQAEDIARAIKTIVLGWLPAPTTGGGTAIYRALRMQTPYPYTGEGQTMFALPTAAWPSTVALWKSSSGEGGPYELDVAFSETPEPPNRLWPRDSTLSGQAVADGDTGTGWVGGPSLSYDLGRPYAIVRAELTYMDGNEGIAKTFRYQYADIDSIDDADWTTATEVELPATGAGPHVAMWADVGAHRYWRWKAIDYWAGEDNMWIGELGFYEEETDLIRAIILDSAPAYYWTLRADYHEAIPYTA